MTMYLMALEVNVSSDLAIFSRPALVTPLTNAPQMLQVTLIYI